MFEADVGIAAKGLRWIFIKHERDTYSTTRSREVDLQPVVLEAFENLAGSTNLSISSVTTSAELENAVTGTGMVLIRAAGL